MLFFRLNMLVAKKAIKYLIADYVLKSQNACYNAFPVIQSHYDNTSHQAKTNYEHNLSIYKSTLELREELMNSVPKKGSNKLTVNERISLLKDNGSPILYLSTNAGLNMPYGTVKNGGAITAVTKIMNRYCMISANEWTFKGGTSYPITVKKQLRAQEIAFDNRLPCIYVVDSGGAFLPLQADIYADKEHGGRAFRNEAVLSSYGIPQIAVVCGPCTAGGAYIPTMCDEAIIVKGTGSLYLGGPPLVQAATGEVIGSEELGGADVHCGISGCTDHYAEDERSAMNIARHVVESLNMETQIISTRIEPREPLYHDRSMEDMARLIPADDHDSIIGDWPMMDILARIFDGSEFHHFKEKFGCNLICGFTRLNGYLVGVVANDGLLDTTASIKGSHFIRICDGRNIPIIFFQNTLSDDEFLSPTGNGGTTAKARSAMMATLSCTQVPKLTIVMGGSYGPTSYAMCGRCMSPNFMFSWPNARIGIASSHHIMDYIKGQDESPHEDDYFVLLKERFDQIAGSHSSHLIDDGTILPHETRHVLSLCLDICMAYPKPPVDRTCPVIRM